MSDGPSRRRVLFDETGGDDTALASVRRGETTVGEMLAQLRETRGLDLGEVAAHLCIREPFLAALETGDLARLPGPTYAIGFVRSYAAFLGLDGEEAVRLFKDERTEEAQPSALVFPEPVAESRIPKGAILFISVILAGAAYGGWYYLTSRDMDLADLVPQVPTALLGESPAPANAAVSGKAAEEPEPPAAVQTETGTESNSAATATSMPATGSEAESPASATAEIPADAPPPSGDTEPASAAVQPATLDQPAAPASPAPPESTAEEVPAPSEHATAPVPPPQPERPVPPPASPATRAAEPPAAAAQPAARSSAGTATENVSEDRHDSPPEAEVAKAPPTIELRATADSWVQVRGDGGRVVLMRILRTGDTYKVPDEKGLTLMTGNAGAIEIRVDGKVVPSIGPMGAVRRNVALDAERLRAGTAVTR